MTNLGLPQNSLATAIANRTAIVGVVGLGYVGLPLATAVSRAGFPTTGFDLDPTKPAMIQSGTSYIDAVSNDELQQLVNSGRLCATTVFERLSECDVIIICVPTPLTRHREPDLSYIVSTADTITTYLRRGQLVVLESTTYPGTTREVLKPKLERSGLTAGVDFFLGFSPEREDPGNKNFSTASIPKIIAGDGAEAGKLISSFYSAVVEIVVPVSSPEVAEAAKITENVFRAVNIAMVNELKVIYDSMSIDVWEVIEAAKTKPFGFMPFYPGPGLGGHCIPIDPFYLSWKAREQGISTRFIELAGEINLAMPKYVVGKLEQALGDHLSLPLHSARILLIGLAYKKNVSDIRESPALRLTELLERRGAIVSYHDPHVPVIHPTREHPEYSGRSSVTLTEQSIREHEATLICTDHDIIDFEQLVHFAPLIVDTRNAIESRGLSGRHIVKA
jgi:UDP-N-acetyl-D-glucosamine dehydrogenase